MNKILLVVLVSVGLCCGCSALLGRTSRAKPSPVKGQTAPQRGLQVTEIFSDSPAEAAGLRSQDVITKYGEFEIIDDASFFAAKNHYESAGIPSAELVFWRGLTRMSAQVRSGWLGVQANEYDKASQEFMKLMQELNVMRELPQYLIDRGIYKFTDKTPARTLVHAKAILDQAERDGTMTPSQILVYRIYSIPDDAPAEDQQQLDELLQKLIASQPQNYIEHMGTDKFFKDKRYRAAIACFKQHLKRTSDDVSVRLNMGVAYNEVRMYNEANSAADYVFEHKLGLSEHGQTVAYTVKATAAMGLKDYRASIQYAKKAFSLEPKYYPISLIQLAAAETGDLKLLDDVTWQFMETSLQQYSKAKISSDAVKAYALAKANRNDDARKIVKGLKNEESPEGKVIDYWRKVPNGMVVANTFGELMKS